MPTPATTRRLGYLGIAFVVALSTIVWVYALVLSDPKPTDSLSDPAFARAAQPICKATVDELRAAGVVDKVAASPQERASLAASADAVVAAMLERLGSHVPTTNDDGRIVSAWLGDWRAWLEDRATWETMLRTGRDGPFDERQRETGEPNSQALDKLASNNHMPDCTIPLGI
ncbi:MAG: hypothetical protein ACR2LQ_05740 [Acidimicrobiales bacterium]